MKTLHEMLNKCQCKFEIIKHEQPILTREVGATYFGIEIGQTAATLILKRSRFLCAYLIGKSGAIGFSYIS